MKHIVEKISIGFIVLSLFVSPLSTVHAAAIDEQRVALIEQLITILQDKLAVLVAQLEAQQAEITTLKQPVFGSTMTEKTPFTITASIQWGSGSWKEYEKQCIGEKALREKGFDCANDVLDGKAMFTLDKPYKTAVITYFPTNEPTQVIHNNLAVPQGYFQPETDYTWSIEATNELGEVAHTEGAFKTGKY